jgi:type II secretory pathway predicted ATPase ExeA
MYKNHFGLERRIFRGNAAGDDVFVGPQTATILNGVKKALAAPDAVVTLTGPVGCGKSTTAAHSLSAIGGRNAIVRVGRFPLQRGELLDLLFDHMRIQQRPPRGNQKLALFRQLLLNLAQNDSRMLILVEDALFLGADILAELEAVTAADAGPSDGAAVLVLGDESLGDLLASKPLVRLRQRIRQRRNLEACGVEELHGYLRHCFRQAGGDFDTVFGDGAPEHLHRLSGGILRVLNNLVESSMEAAAEAGADAVSLDLVSRIADEEFGLTGAFARLPDTSSERPELRHTDDATAKLLASSLPDPKPDSQPAATEQRPAEKDDNAPELIQDTQPALAVLDDSPPKAAPPAPSFEDTLADIEKLSAELSADSGSPGESAPQPGTEPAATAKPDTAQSDESLPEPPPAEEADQQAAPEGGLKLQPESPETDSAIDETLPSASEAAGKPAAVTGGTTAGDDVPDWERDPTLAELRPDLDALERAMAVAHGKDPDTPEDPAPAPQAAEKDTAQDEIEDIPQITLDDSINRKVDKAALESKQRAETEAQQEAEEADEEHEQTAGEGEVAAGEQPREKQAVAELEEIAVGLSKAKTIEDVDDKMAETLFGEELNAAAAAVAAKVAEEAAAAAANTMHDTPVPQANSGATSMEQEFETVWGEKPGVEVSIESQIEDHNGGLDISASQRLATVRALNAGQPVAVPQKAPVAAALVAKPDPIEEQITTSLTQTMKILNVTPAPGAVNDDVDDDDGDDGENKGGFFSRFRRS